MSLDSMPNVEKVEIARVQRDDVIIATLAPNATIESADQAAKVLKAVFPNNEVLVLMNDVKLTFARPDEHSKASE